MTTPESDSQGNEAQLSLDNPVTRHPKTFTT
jgi:hypothetical protein